MHLMFRILRSCQTSSEVAAATLYIVPSEPCDSEELPTSLLHFNSKLPLKLTFSFSFGHWLNPALPPPALPPPTCLNFTFRWQLFLFTLTRNRLRHFPPQPSPKMLQPTVNRGYRKLLVLVRQTGCLQGLYRFHVPERNMRSKGNVLSMLVHACVPALRGQRASKRPAWATQHTYVGLYQV